MTNNCPTNDNPTATRKVRFDRKPMLKIDFDCERQLNALNKSKNTKVVNVMVASLGVTSPSNIREE